MINRKAALIVALTMGTMCRAEDKGSCPPSPTGNMAARKKASPPESPSADKKYFGTVTLLAEISDQGYVCRPHVLSGISKEINKKTEMAARGWHFEPARKNGHTVPVVVSVAVNYWTTSAGEIVSDPPPQSLASSDKAGNKPVP